MASVKQRKAVDKIMENHGVVSKAMEQAGYSKQTAKNPKNLTDSKGYAEILEEYGLTDGLVVKSLVEDIEKKPQNRVQELNLAAKIKGMIIDKKDLTSNGDKLEGLVIIKNTSDDIKERE